MTDRDWLARISPNPNTLWRGWWEPGTIEPRRRLYDHELVLFTAGDCVLRLGAGSSKSLTAAHHRKTNTSRARNSDPDQSTSDGAREIPCPAGSFAIIPPDTDHVTIAGPARVHRVCVHFDWIWQADGALPICAFHPARPRADLLRPAPSWVPRDLLHGRALRLRTVEDLLATAFRRWESGGPDGARARAALLDALLILLGDAAGGASTPAPDLAPRIKAALDASIEKQIDVQIDAANPPPALGTLLASFGVTAEHAGRTFTRAFGLPPVRYLNAVRLERAAGLLRKPGARVTTVARACGFTDPRYFARCFRAHTGVAPGRWRNQA